MKEEAGRGYTAYGMDYQERKESIDFDTAIASAANYVLLEILNSGCDVAVFSVDNENEKILLRLLNQGNVITEEDLLSRSYFKESFRQFTAESIFLVILRYMQAYLNNELSDETLRHGFYKYQVGGKELSVEIKIEGDPVPQRMILRVMT